MVNLNSRMKAIERLLQGDDGGPLPERIPEHWGQRDPITGDWLGPTPDEHATPGQQRMLDTLRPMLESVPFAPLAN